MPDTPDTASATACEVCGHDIFDGCTCPRHPNEDEMIADAIGRVAGPDLVGRVLSSLTAEGFTIVAAADLHLAEARATELQIAVDRIAACHQPHLALWIAKAAEYGKTRFGV